MGSTKHPYLDTPEQVAVARVHLQRDWTLWKPCKHHRLSTAVQIAPKTGVNHSTPTGKCGWAPFDQKLPSCGPGLGLADDVELVVDPVDRNVQGKKV